MHLVVHDFETFWSKTHSLSKLGPIDYVLHPETEIISLSVTINDEQPIVVFGEDEALKLLDDSNLDDALLIAHNNEGFDALLTGMRFKRKPKMWGCTLAMARPFFAKTVGLSLAKVAKELGVGIKNDAVLHDTMGKHLSDFTALEISRMRAYNGDDSVLCRGIFRNLAKRLGPQELFHIDNNIRMLAEPRFVADIATLQAGLQAEIERKRVVVTKLADMMREQYVDLELDWDDDAAVNEFVTSEMASTAKLSKLLEARGVDVPMKPSPTPPKDGQPRRMVPALAKTDEEFKELLEHPDEFVAAAARARLAVKSTITETRLESMLHIANLCDGQLPIPLKVYGADTTGRDSGWMFNPQNFPRIGWDKDGKIIDKPSNAMRLGLRAPDGFVVGVADQSGIELRMNHWFWGVVSTQQLYEQDPRADLYRAFATFYFNKLAEEITKDERQFAKVCQLGLGFGSGAKTFRRVARIMGNVILDMSASEMAVAGWRERYSDIVAGWRTCSDALLAISQGRSMELGPGGIVTTTPEGLLLPSGRMIRYPDLRYIETDEKWDDGRKKSTWVYGHGRHQTFLHGPKVDENIIQALARDSVFECAYRFFKLSGFRPVMRLHDELIYMFPTSEAAALLAELQRIMRTAPSWGPSLILWSEGDIAGTYGEAK